jgi:hypothetical protein
MVHPRQPCGTCPVHPVERIGDRDQPGADPAVALPPGLPAQFAELTSSRNRQIPRPEPQRPLLARPPRRNSFGESVSTQVGIRCLSKCPAGFRNIGIMLALRLAMIQHEPPMTRKTIRMPNVRARILFV